MQKLFFIKKLESNKHLCIAAINITFFLFIELFIFLNTNILFKEV